MEPNTRTAAVGFAILLTLNACFPAEWGANAILHPYRRAVTITPDLPFQDVSFISEGVTLRGWLFKTAGKRRALLVYLHGSSDNRESGIGFAHRFVPQGFDVLAYDSRGHGDSGGDACTYGFYEKRDLARALDELNADRVIVFGTSLGGAVALQAAANDPRIIGVIAQSSFSDLETVARQRAPFIATRGEIDAAFRLAEERGRFKVADVSAVNAAARIHVPVLLIHGARDSETRPSHSQAIYAALAGPKELFLVPGAGHNDTLANPETWRRIDGWLSRVAPAR
jgi:pimeloyl-ACP methyl ester carboxylesterase